jgi:hypothetical protein
MSGRSDIFFESSEDELISYSIGNEFPKMQRSVATKKLMPFGKEFGRTTKVSAKGQIVMRELLLESRTDSFAVSDVLADWKKKLDRRTVQAKSTVFFSIG